MTRNAFYETVGFNLPCRRMPVEYVFELNFICIFTIEIHLNSQCSLAMDFYDVFLFKFSFK